MKNTLKILKKKTKKLRNQGFPVFSSVLHFEMNPVPGSSTHVDLVF